LRFSNYAGHFSKTINLISFSMRKIVGIARKKSENVAAGHRRGSDLTLNRVTVLLHRKA